MPGGRFGSTTPECSASQRLPQAVVVTKEMTRERVKAKLERAGDRFPEPCRTGLPAGTRPRLAGPSIPGGADPNRTRCALSLSRSPRKSAPPRAPGALQLDGAGARSRSGLTGPGSPRAELATASLSLNAVVSGVTATQMRSGIYLVDVLVGHPPSSACPCRRFARFRCRCRTGGRFLSQIASVDCQVYRSLASRCWQGGVRVVSTRRKGPRSWTGGPKRCALKWRCRAAPYRPWMVEERRVEAIVAVLPVNLFH